jgi:hypothetical protein
MDARRSRRTRDPARKSWYAYYRQVRFARWFGYIQDEAELTRALRAVPGPSAGHLTVHVR